MFPTNQDMSNLTSVLTSRPSGQVVKFNAGVSFNKSTRKQIRDNVMMLMDYNRLDRKFVSAGVTDVATWRMTEDLAFFSGMADTMAGHVFYGDETSDPGQMNGLGVRYDTLPTSNYAFSTQNYTVLNGGGSGADNSSIYLVDFSRMGVHGLYPRNSRAGLNMREVSPQMMAVDDTPATSGEAEWFITAFEWFMGLSVANWRHAGRIANIDMSDLEAGTGADLFSLMLRLKNRVRGTNRFFLMNGDTLALLERDQRFSMEEYQIAGTDQYRPLKSFGGIPILHTDALLYSESVVS